MNEDKKSLNIYLLDITFECFMFAPPLITELSHENAN